MTTKPGKGLLTSASPRPVKEKGDGAVFAVVIIAVLFTGFFSYARLVGAGSQGLGNSGMFITTLSCLSTLTFLGRLVWMIIAKCRGKLYPAAWTSAALAPERSVVLGGLLLIVFAIVATAAFDKAPDLPDSLAPLVVGALFGLPLVEVFVARAHAWGLFVTDRDPD